MKVTRRVFMRRAALVAAGGLAVPPWASWLGEQMDKLRPKKHFTITAPETDEVELRSVLGMIFSTTNIELPPGVDPPTARGWSYTSPDGRVHTITLGTPEWRVAP